MGKPKINYHAELDFASSRLDFVIYNKNEKEFINTKVALNKVSVSTIKVDAVHCTLGTETV